MAKVENDGLSSSKNETRQPSVMDKFLISPATKDTCVYADLVVNKFHNQVKLIYKRLERLTTDSKMKVDPFLIFILTSSDFSNLQLINRLRNSKTIPQSKII